jgi:hypothetical protein
MMPEGESANPLPQLAGEGGAERRMGCGKQESADESFAMMVVQCDTWFKALARHDRPFAKAPGANRGAQSRTRR